MTAFFRQLSIAFIFLTLSIASHSQWRREFQLPAGYNTGLSFFYITYKPEFYIEKLGDGRQLRLRMNIKTSTATKMEGSYKWQYSYYGKTYSDGDVGRDAFNPINFSMDLNISVMGNGTLFKNLVVSSDLSSYEIAFVKDGTDPGSFIVQIDGIKSVYFRGTELIDRKIVALQQADKDAKAAAKKKEEEEKEREKQKARELEKQKEKEKQNASKENTDKKTATDNVGNKEKTGQQEDKEEDIDAINKKLQEEAALKSLKNAQDRVAANREIERQLDEKLDQMGNAFSAGRQSEKAQKEIKEAANLKSFYASIDELNADFNNRIATMNTAAETMKQQMTSGYNSMANAMYGSGSTMDNAFNSASKLLGGFIANAKADKERERAEARLESQRKAMKEKMEADQLKMLIDIRTSLFSKFKKASLPTATSKISDNIIYYFVYAIDSAMITNKYATLQVSNVFPIAQYKDGTWPFASAIQKEIDQLTPLKETIHGYYSSREEAETMLSAMKDIFTKTEGNIKTISYKGRPVVGGTESSDGDFWGNKKKDSTDKDKKPASKSDFWNQ